MGPRLIIVCGLPRSGKTSHAKQLARKLPAVRLCPDEWMDAQSLSLYDEERRARIETLQWQFGRQLLALGLTVIIEWGTWARSERDALRTEARTLGATVELHYLTASVELLFDRIQRRGLENPPMSPRLSARRRFKGIERAMLVRWSELFQPPTPDELELFDHAEVITFT